MQLRIGDVVLIRTGRMQHVEDERAYEEQAPGLGLDAAKFLVEEGGAMSIGADNLSFEAFPSDQPGNYVPVHTYLLAEHGVTLMEVVNLEALARDGVHEFAFIGASLKFRGASAAPMRPLAFPLAKE
jgi:kynurenine formamidase